MKQTKRPGRPPIRQGSRRRSITVTIDEQMLTLWDTYCEQQGISRGESLNKLLEPLLKKG